MGLSRHIIRDYVEKWTTEIRDVTPQVRKMAALLKEGHKEKAAALLPKERPYPLTPELARRLYRSTG